MTRQRLARALLLLATIWWGAWFGGQLFNALMVVPHFSSAPPESLLAWGAMRRHFVADFFVICNSLWILLMLFAAIVLGRGRRRWTIASAACAAISVGALLWMVPAISRVVARGGPLRDLEMWTAANWGRTAVELVGFACAVAGVASADELR